MPPKAAEDAKTEIINKAQEEAKNLKNKATAEIEAATEQAKIELKILHNFSINGSRKSLQARAITEDDHKKMVKDFVDEAGDLLCSNKSVAGRYAEAFFSIAQDTQQD